MQALPAAWVVRFAQPVWLIAAAAAPLPVIWALRARRRGRWLSWVSVALQCGAVVAAAVALARPSLPAGRKASRPWLILRDVSPSMRGQMDPVPAWPDDLPKEAMHFAEAVLPPGRPADPSAPATFAAGALKLAEARADGLAGVVVVTDGQFHDVDWPAAARALGRTGLRVMVVGRNTPPRDARIADLSADRPAGAAAAELRLTVVANARMRRTVIVRRAEPDGEPILTRTLELLPDSPVSLRLTDAAPADRAVAYRAALGEPDEVPENDAASALVLPRQERLAFVAAAQADRREGFQAALGLAVAAVAPAGAPADAAGWMDYAAVVLVDASGELLDGPRRAALARYVRGGGGLVLVGCGPCRSPADHADPLDRVAALVANPYQRTPLHVIVVLDVSGSMAEPVGSPGGGRRKYDQAAEAVLALKRHLTPDDRVTAVVFSDSARPVYASGAGPCDFAELRARLNAVSPGGRTRAGPALLAAADVPHLPNRQGLVLLVSDLLTEPFAPAAVEAAFRRNDLRLAIVAVSAGAEEPPSGPGGTPLADLARRLEAPLRRTDSLAGLAEIFAAFLRNRRGNPIRLGRFEPAAGTLFAAQPEKLPPLDAYLLSAANPGAEVLARVDGDGLIARRQAGLGRSVSLAVPLAGHNRLLGTWPGLDGLLARAARWAMRPAADGRFAARVDRTGGQIHLRIDARGPDGPVNVAGLAVRAVGPSHTDDPPREAQLAQVGPGRYEGSIAAPPGAVGLQVLDATGRVVWRGPAGGTYPREFAALGADWEALRKLADLAGGRVVRESDLASAAGKWDVRRRVAVWPHAVLLALAAMLLDWALTRVRRGQP